MNKAETIAQLKPPVRGLILDGDGVLWKDRSPIGDVSAMFERIRKAGLKAVLATNNATMTVDSYIEKFAGFGVKLEEWQIVTSAHAAAAALLRAFPDKGALYVVGETGVINALCEAGFSTITDPDDDTPVVAVVAGMDRGMTYDKVRRAMWHIRAGARFYGTNPDKTFPTPAGLVPGAGVMLAAIQAATGTDPIIIGKPAPFMFELCAERMGLDLSEVLAVGDRLETDIAGAQGVGARTALVLTGVSTREQAEQWTPRPDIIAADLASLLAT